MPQSTKQLLLLLLLVLLEYNIKMSNLKKTGRFPRREDLRKELYKLTNIDAPL